MFVKTDKENNIISYPYSLEKFKQDNKTASLPKTLTNSYLARQLVFPVYNAPTPEYDKLTQFLIKEKQPYKDATDGQWKIGWVVVDMTPEQQESAVEIHRRTLKLEINKERDTRISGGFEWNGHVFQSDSTSYENIMSVANSATAAILTGTDQDDVNWTGEETPFTWIAKNNTFVEMSPKAVIEFARAATLHKSSHFLAARNLKNMEIIPEDYTDDKWWK